jgi:TatD DNase family protein
MIDTHVNLHHEAFEADLPAVLARARAAGVDAMISICDRLESIPAIKAIADGDAAIWRTVGVHPHHAKDAPDLTAEALIALAEDPKVVAIGETGLDLHYEFSPLEAQERGFRAHVAAARETGLPLIVHTRMADERTAAILEDETAAGAFPILLHCYTSGLDLLARGLALGAFVSISGIATFKNAHDVREAARRVPPDRLLIETDCPYLAPVPQRGRRNEPAFLPHVAAFLADLSGEAPEAFAARVDDNARALFQRLR